MVRVNDSVCIHHTDVPAVGRCRQCHVPFCEACKTDGPQGTYCSVECRAKHELYVNKAEQLRKRSRSPVPLIVVLVLLAIAAVIALHFAGVRVPIICDWLGGMSAAVENSV